MCIEYSVFSVEAFADLNLTHWYFFENCPNSQILVHVLLEIEAADLCTKFSHSFNLDVLDVPWNLFNCTKDCEFSVINLTWNDLWYRKNHNIKLYLVPSLNCSSDVPIASCFSPSHFSSSLFLFSGYFLLRRCLVATPGRARLSISSRAVKTWLQIALINWNFS